MKLRLVVGIVLVFDPDERFEVLGPEDAAPGGISIIRSDEMNMAFPPLGSERVVGLASPSEAGVTVNV